MTVTTICKGCGAELAGKDEEELVVRVQTHVAEAHPSGHVPTREQVLAVLRARGTDTA